MCRNFAILDTLEEEIDLLKDSSSVSKIQAIEVELNVECKDGECVINFEEREVKKDKLFYKNSPSIFIAQLDLPFCIQHFSNESKYVRIFSNLLR